MSNFLEQIEINRDNEIVINKLDEYHSNPKAHVIGITGSPGVGKSSKIDKLIQKIRKKKSVGIIAVDPSSRETGGALLGDRTRFFLIQQMIMFSDRWLQKTILEVSQS